MKGIIKMTNLESTNNSKVFNAEYESCPTIEGSEYFYIYMPKTKAEQMIKQAGKDIENAKAYDYWENQSDIDEAKRQLAEIDTEYVLLTGNVGMSSTHVDTAFWGTTEEDLETLVSYENDEDTANRLSLLAKAIKQD